MVPAKPKPIWRDQAAAEWGARIHYRNTLRAGWYPTQLYVYECPGMDHWHLTTKAGGRSIIVPLPSDEDRGEGSRTPEAEADHLSETRRGATPSGPSHAPALPSRGGTSPSAREAGTKHHLATPPPVRPRSAQESSTEPPRSDA